MATNPNRPSYQDTIESSWGQSVADHVIRRYPSAAARDADLAGHTAADLAGQYVAINPTPGDVSLWRHDGSAWNAVPIVKSGLSGFTTNSASQVAVSFLTPFPAGYVVYVVLQPALFGGPLVCDGPSASTIGFTSTIFHVAGGGVGAGQPIPISWVAVGWPAGSSAQLNGGRQATEAEREAMLAEAAARGAEEGE